jgi:hypothetical protein
LEQLQGPNVPYPYRIDWCKDTQVPEFPTLWMPYATETKADSLEYLSEDYAAAMRLSLCDVPHLAYKPSQPLWHWGEYPYGFKTYGNPS